ncbi:alpha/beta hydrolase [Paraburkholderia haematera]|uniref:alpha/beta hydrolase n=1 Tax=Paraburkholderia haematera TaxID=2793077 RepID=UPI001B8BC966|nr:alpha/beta hydrolase-fold protein [Paraburkholderia haematera]
MALPWLPAPESGYRVLYVLDAHAYFTSALEAVRANVRDVVVVGIGYPSDPAFVKKAIEPLGPLPGLNELTSMAYAFGLTRMYDLSLPVSADVLAKENIPMFNLTTEQVGGLDDFLATIETEVKPRVAEMVSIDSSNQAIFGHSLGGLAVLHALFVEPNAFRTFIAASPSIWWSEKAVLANEDNFSAAVVAGAVSPRVLVTMGSEEETAKPVPAGLKMDQAEFDARIRSGRMVENARELTARLQALRGSNGYQVEDYAVFAKQGHGLAAWPALGRAIDFAFN